MFASSNDGDLNVLKQPGKKRTRQLWRLQAELSKYESAYNSTGIRLLDEWINQLDEYDGIADVWHNLAMGAARINHHQAELAIIEAGLRQWPDDIDLLCDLLQLRFTTAFDLEDAKKIWCALEAMDKRKTGVYWRYWVFGAQYYAKVLGDTQRAVELLDEGLRYVNRDGLMNIFNNYRRILVDFGPKEVLDSPEKVHAYQKEILEVLEQRYKTGLELGIENGYVLAVSLARLYQERSAEYLSHQNQQKLSDELLDKALIFLDLAERLYTNNSNHPLWDIYLMRARLYAAQKQYHEVYNLLQSVPRGVIDRDPSMQTMLRYAAIMTGQQLQDDAEPDRSEGQEKISIEECSQKLTAILTDADSLYKIAMDKPQVREALFTAAIRIQREQQGKP